MGLLFVAALGVTFALNSASATADSLFQSPQSPVEGQAAPPANPTPVPPQPPPDTAAPVQNPPAPEAQPNPVDAGQPAPAEGVAPAPAEAGQSAPGEGIAPAPAGEAPLPPPLPEPERRSSRDSTPPANGDAQMVVDQAEFIDTVVVSFAYVWLCCGIVLILVIPLIFLFLHIRGRSKMLKEEQY